MNTVVILIIGASCVVAVGSSLTHPKHRALSEGALSLILILAIASPVYEYVSGVIDSAEKLPNLPSVEGSEGEYERVAKEAFLLGIERLIADEYGLDGEDVSVKCDGFDFSSFSCERIYVTLSGGAATADYRGIKNFIEENFEGECIIEIEIG